MSSRMQTSARLAAAALAALLALACGDGNNGATPQLTVIDAVYPATVAYDVLLDNGAMASALGYGQGTAAQAVAQGAHTVAFEPTGTTTTQASAGFAAAPGQRYTVYAYENAGALAALAVARDQNAIASGQARLGLVSLDPSQGALDWYVTAPDATLPAVPSLAAVAFVSNNTVLAPASLLLSAGALRLRAVASGDSTQTVVYDSGPMTLTPGSDTLAALVATSGSAATFTLLLDDVAGNLYAVPDQRVQLRVGNFAPALATVDAFLDPSGSANSSANLVAASLAGGGASPYTVQLPGAYEASVAASGQTLGIVNAPLTLAGASAVSLFAVGVSGQASPDELQLLALADDLRVAADGSARLRVAQLAPDLAAVDAVLLDTSGVTPVITRRLAVQLAYPAASAYVDLPAGSYTVALVPTGLDQPLLPANGASVSLAASGVSTLVAWGCRYPSSGICGAASTPLQLELLTDR